MEIHDENVRELSSTSSELAEVRSNPDARRSPEKKNADLRIRELLGDRKRDRERIAALESQLSDRTREVARQEEASSALRADLDDRNRELAEFRAERDGKQERMPERIAAAREAGRKLYADFDAVCAFVSLDRQAFDAMLTSANGPELMYAAGVGFKALGILRQLQGQAQADKQRVEYYKKLHQQHFAGANNNGR